MILLVGKYCQIKNEDAKKATKKAKTKGNCEKTYN